MRNVTGEQIAQVDNPDPFASPVWRSPVYRTPEFVIWLVQLLRLLVRVVWFVAAPSAAGCGGGAGGAHLAAGGLARRDRAGGRRAGGPGRAAGQLAALVRPAGVRPGPQPVAVVVLPAALAGRDDHCPAGPDLPGPGRRPRARPGPGHRLHRPGVRPAGVRAVPRRLRRTGRGHRARLPGAPMPGPHRQAGCCGAGAGPPGRARRPDGRPARSRRDRPAGAAGGAARGRDAVRGPAPGHAPADRGRDRRR